jgi:hypothetical protein
MASIWSMRSWGWVSKLYMRGREDGCVTCIENGHMETYSFKAYRSRDFFAELDG